MENTQETSSEKLDNCRKLMRFGRFSEAETIIRQIISNEPDNFDAELELIRSALFQDKYDDAYALLGAAAEKQPQNPMLVGLQGIWMLETQQFPQAAAVLQYAAEHLPEDSTIQCNLAIAYRNLRLLKEAETHARKAIALNEHFELAHYELSKILTLLGRIEEAMQEVLKTIESNPYFIIAYKTLAEFFRSQKNLDAIIELYRAGSRLVPDEDYFWSQLGHLYQEKGDYNNALECIQHLCAKRNFFSDHLREGIYLALLGRAEPSIEAFNKAIQISPDKWEPYHNIAEIMVRQKNLDAAEKYYTEAVKYVNKVDYRPYCGLAYVYIRKNDLQKALPLLTTAHQINPNTVDVLLNFALVYQLLGNKVEALNWARQAKDKSKDLPGGLEQAEAMIKALSGPA